MKEDNLRRESNCINIIFTFKTTINKKLGRKVSSVFESAMAVDLINLFLREGKL